MKKEGQYIYGGGSGQGGHSPATRQGLVRGEIYDGVAARGVNHLLCHVPLIVSITVHKGLASGVLNAPRHPFMLDQHTLAVLEHVHSVRDDDAVGDTWRKGERGGE